MVVAPVRCRMPVNSTSGRRPRPAACRRVWCVAGPRPRPTHFLIGGLLERIIYLNVGLQTGAPTPPSILSTRCRPPGCRRPEQTCQLVCSCPAARRCRCRIARAQVVDEVGKRAQTSVNIRTSAQSLSSTLNQFVTARGGAADGRETTLRGAGAGQPAPPFRLLPLGTPMEVSCERCARDIGLNAC